MKIKKRELFTALAIVSGAGILLSISYDASIIFACAGAFALGAIFRRHQLRGWIPALIVAFVWVSASGDVYHGYNTFKLHVFGKSIFPMLAWPAGLVMGYYYIVPHIKIKSWPKRWLVLSLVYSFGLIVLETIGYNVLNIKLDTGNGYPGWPVLNILHCPWWMQVVYFANGIIFMGAVSWMDRHQFSGKKPKAAFSRKTAAANTSETETAKKLVAEA